MHGGSSWRDLCGWVGGVVVVVGGARGVKPGLPETDCLVPNAGPSAAACRVIGNEEDDVGSCLNTDQGTPLTRVFHARPTQRTCTGLCKREWCQLDHHPGV